MRLSDLVLAFREAGIPDPALEARLLFIELGGFAPHTLLGRDPNCDAPALETAKRRRLTREPLAYILGHAPFYKEDYSVAPGVLIPRADTELLVEHAIAAIPKGGHFADLCTGSGCIAVSVLASRPDLTADAFDISDIACRLASENAERNHVRDRIRITKRDLLSAPPADRYDAILSNPPYITDDIIPTLSPEVKHEPVLALSGGEDGLRFYRRFLVYPASLFRKKRCFLFEIGYDQEEAMRMLAEEHELSVTIHRDLSGNPRLAVMTD